MTDGVRALVPPSETPDTRRCTMMTPSPRSLFCNFSWPQLAFRPPDSPSRRYGFVVPGSAMPQLDRDVFIPRGAVGDAIMAITYSSSWPHHARPAGQRAKAASCGSLIGRIDRLLDCFATGRAGTSCFPYDTRIQHQVEIPPATELTASLEKSRVGDSKELDARAAFGRIEELDGAVVMWSCCVFEGRRCAGWTVIEILGKPGRLGRRHGNHYRKHHLPHEFP